MKLELKHIAPYLPYELKMIGKVGQTEDLNVRNIVHALQYWKPILRPLSDLIKEIQIAEYYMTYKEHLKRLYPSETIGLNPATWSHRSVCWLFEYHFDLFGLIEKCLAVDINSLVELNGSFNSH